MPDRRPVPRKYFRQKSLCLREGMAPRLQPESVPQEVEEEQMGETVAAFTAYHDDWKAILPVASAVELIHSYSLIHDDLPAMDNDDLRRGKASCHKQFGEAIAILAGDALLTLAFDVLSRCQDFPSDRILGAISMLARAAGTCEGMIAGLLFYKPQLGTVVAAVLVLTLGWRALLGVVITGAVLTLITIVTMPGKTAV